MHLLKQENKYYFKTLRILNRGAIFIIALFLINLSCTSLSKNSSLKEYTYSNIALGNIVRFTLIANDEKTAEKAYTKSHDLIKKLEKDFNYRNRNGEIGQINRNAGIKPVKCSNITFSLIKRAIEFSKKTDGIFDITIGAYSGKDYFYTKKITAKKLNLINYRLIRLDSINKTVFLPLKKMAIDPGGIAKGTIIDWAIKDLKKSGIGSGIVEIGGDLFCFGNRKWFIGIQNPRGEGLISKIKIKNSGICGSGDYYQYIKRNRKRSHHIIDIKKRDSSTESISVITVAPTTELADALATTLMITGPMKGKKLLRKNFPDCSAIWIDSSLDIISSDNFPKLIRFNKK